VIRVPSDQDAATGPPRPTECSHGRTSTIRGPRGLALPVGGLIVGLGNDRGDASVPHDLTVGPAGVRLVAGQRGRALPGRPIPPGRVTATAGLVAATATHQLPPQTRRSGRRRRVPMLYGTRRGSRPALLPRVCVLSWGFGTRSEALQQGVESHERDFGTCALDTGSIWRGVARLLSSRTRRATAAGCRPRAMGRPRRIMGSRAMTRGRR
jgi:hypothetical protein